MDHGLSEKIINLMIKGSRAQRYAICDGENGLLYFAVYYFPEYFTHQIPSFHYDFYQDGMDLANCLIDEVAWFAFRESAKTSLAKILLCYMICHKKKRYINVDSYDKGNAEAILFDTTVSLQTNLNLIANYGHLFYKRQAKDALSEAKLKRINNFITENDIKVEAFSTQESTRGRLYKNMRPDFFLLDDFENNRTKDSYPLIHKIKDHINEMRAGLPIGAGVLYLGNYITEDGVVSFIMEALKRSPKGRIRLINIADDQGNPTWPDKHTKTQTEASEANAHIDDPRARKKSLEEIKMSLGPQVYAAEMMNNPAHGGDKVFDRDRIEELLKIIKPPLRTVAGFKIWYEFNPSHRYALAADTAKGIGRDANASATIDFSTIPNRLVATYKNNLMAPDIFAYELKRQAEIFGLPLIAPEINNTGYATMTQLKRIYNTNKIFVPLQDEKVKQPLSPDYGWDTNAATKPEMMFQLKRAVEDGLLLIFDQDVLNEMKYYGQKDLTTYKLIEGMTRHYDLLTAVAICWMMRTHAKMPDTLKKKAIQAPHIPTAGEYGG